MSITGLSSPHCHQQENRSDWRSLITICCAQLSTGRATLCGAWGIGVTAIAVNVSLLSFSSSLSSNSYKIQCCVIQLRLSTSCWDRMTMQQSSLSFFFLQHPHPWASWLILMACCGYSACRWILAASEDALSKDGSGVLHFIFFKLLSSWYMQNLLIFLHVENYGLLVWMHRERVGTFPLVIVDWLGIQPGWWGEHCLSLLTNLKSSSSLGSNACAVFVAVPEPCYPRSICSPTSR